MKNADSDFDEIIFEDEEGNRHIIDMNDFEAFDDAMSHENWHLVFE